MSSSLSSPHPETFTKEEFRALPTEGPDFLLDVEAIQQRMNARAQTPFRRDTGFFQVPIDASTAAIEAKAKESIGKWINWNAKEHWELVTDVRISRPVQARDINSGAVLLGLREYRYTAGFRWRGPAPKPVRIELDPATVKRDPAHRLTLKEAMRAWNVKAVNLRASAKKG